jgi:hypothetical protein
MRNNLVRVAAILGVGTSAILVASLGSGCGGDDTQVSTLDGSADATADTSMPEVGVTDGNAADTGRDSGHPSIDAGAPVLATFDRQTAEIFCGVLATCCFGSDVSRFDLARCATNEVNNGRNIGLTGTVQPYIDGGRVAFNASLAQTCFDDINSMGCGAISGAVLTQIDTDCLGAVPGTVAVGSTGCTGSPECVPPSHCEIDGGTGTCVAPRAVGSNCGGLTLTENDSTCGHLVTGLPAYCAVPASFRHTNTCLTQQPVDAGCNNFEECKSQLCVATTDPVIVDAGGVGSCQNQTVLATAGLCTYYTRPDAGPSDAGPG